jgi:hypothetical protein
MAKSRKPTIKNAKTGRFVVGESFLKISLVEGIRLTDGMKKRAQDARRQGVSPDEYREAIVRSHRKG